MPQVTPGSTEPRYWRSLSELDDSPEFHAYLEREFPDQDPTEIEVDGFTRRRFLALMGASMALAGAQSCRWEKEEILPFAKRPEGRMPGVPSRYATAFELGGVALPLLVTNYDGRPIKIEGNAEHPASGGATSAIAQAQILGMYDPDRSWSPASASAEGPVDRGLADFKAELASRVPTWKANGGAGLRILSERSSSPTMDLLRKRLATELPQARFVEYEAVHRDAELEGARLAYGRPLRSLFSLERTEVVLCLDEDLLNGHPDAVRNARAWASTRDPESGAMSRLYVVESSYSATGASADNRLPLRSDQGLAFLLAVEAAIDGEPGHDGLLADPKLRAFVGSVAKALGAARGASLVAVGPRQAPAVHAVAHRLNAALGNVGQTLRLVEEPFAPSMPALAGLCRELQAGQVEALLILGGNPVYDAPADLDFGATLAKARFRVHLSVSRDETSLACDWHVNRAHFLEAWGDTRAWDGTHCLVQPQIAPLFQGVTPIELVAWTLGQAEATALDLVREAARGSLTGDFERGWRRALHDGFVAGSEYPAATATLRGFEVGTVAGGDHAAIVNGKLELCFVPDARLHDGRFANNAWLQETPDYLTKLVWDNAALVSPATAEALGLRNGQLVTLELGGRSLDCPVYVLPGQARGSVAIALGGGRRAAGRVGGDEGKGVAGVGFDAGRIRSSAASAAAVGLKVVARRERYSFATTQDMFAIDAVGMAERENRVKGKHGLVREASFEEYKADPAFAQYEAVPLVDLWERPDVSVRHAWGMTIDLGKCTGCNACVVGCQAENNIPVVGKEQVAKGRIMHWIRIDRYFTGDREDPQVVNQPLGCQQCENAPCEQVCPVAATTHNQDGLNDMVYNRCVGTRYCANNCPFKVRRFNYLDFHDDLDRHEPELDLKKMAYNPEVTVRWRGVMEKCTYCVQRIQATRIAVKREGGRSIRDGEIVTACQQACPTGAIVFGDLKQEDSRVSTLARGPRAYQMLKELNVDPRTRYLARVRNTDPALVAKAEVKHDQH